jgi:hypothetical protein
MSVVAQLGGVVLFFAVLFVADCALSRWGSVTIRSRPRPGLRVTVVLAGVVATFAAVGALAHWAASSSRFLAWAVLLMAFPACAMSAVGVDHLLPGSHSD